MRLAALIGSLFMIFLLSCTTDVEEISITIVTNTKLAEKPSSKLPNTILPFIGLFEFDSVIYKTNVQINRIDLPNEDPISIEVPKSWRTKLRQSLLNDYDSEDLKSDYKQNLSKIKAGVYLSKEGKDTVIFHTIFQENDMVFYLSPNNKYSESNIYKNPETLRNKISELILKGEIQSDFKLLIMLNFETIDSIPDDSLFDPPPPRKYELDPNSKNDSTEEIKIKKIADKINWKLESITGGDFQEINPKQGSGNIPSFKIKRTDFNNGSDSIMIRFLVKFIKNDIVIREVYYPFIFRRSPPPPCFIVMEMPQNHNDSISKLQWRTNCMPCNITIYDNENNELINRLIETQTFNLSSFPSGQYRYNIQCQSASLTSPINIDTEPYDKLYFVENTGVIECYIQPNHIDFNYYLEISNASNFNNIIENIPRDNLNFPCNSEDFHVLDRKDIQNETLYFRYKITLKNNKDIYKYSDKLGPYFSECYFDSTKKDSTFCRLSIY